MDVDLVIFDKDGTLIDIHYYWGGMVKLRARLLTNKYIKPKYREKAMHELMSEMGISTKTNKIKSTGPVGIKPREYIINIAYKVVGRYCDTITIGQISSAFKEIDLYSKTHLDKLVKPLPGVEELLTTLKLKKIKVTIATTDLTRRAMLAMDSIGLKHYFDCIAGADLVSNAKPSADLVDYLCKKMECKKNKTLVIGDSIVDLRMAESAQVGFIGVKTGLYSSEFLEYGQLIVEDLFDVNKFI